MGRRWFPRSRGWARSWTGRHCKNTSALKRLKLFYEDLTHILVVAFFMQPYVVAAVYVHQACAGSGWPVLHRLGAHAIICLDAGSFRAAAIEKNNLLERLEDIRIVSVAGRFPRAGADDVGYAIFVGQQRGHTYADAAGHHGVFRVSYAA